MALFKKPKDAIGSTDGELLANGIPAWGAIKDVSLNGTQVTVGVDQYRVCTFAVEVRIDGEQAYTASARQRVHEIALARLSTAGAVCVKVDPTDRRRVQIDFDSPVPVVRLPEPAPGTGRADIVSRGTDCGVVVTQNQPIGLRSHEGDEIHAFVLTVVPVDGTPYQVQVGLPLPVQHLPLVFPGSRLPGKVLPEDPNSVAIVWESVTVA
jgi:hypothetical protein